MNQCSPRAGNLARASLAAKLANRFDEQEDSVHAGVAVGEASTVGVEGEVAAGRRALAGHELASLATLAESQSFERHEHSDGEAVVALDQIDCVVSDVRHLEGSRSRHFRGSKPGQ